MPQLQCVYCKLVWDCETKAEVEILQATQCWITTRGISHRLIGVVP